VTVSSARKSGATQLSLVWRVFAINSGVLVLATLALVISPATVSFPIALTEIVVLVIGIAVMLAVHLALLRRMLAPLEQMAVLMDRVDPLAPGTRVPPTATTPELERVEAAFNRMVGRVESERRESARRELIAQQEERRRIALDLHDQVGQSLTAVILQLDRVAEGLPEERAGQVAAAREATRSTLDEVREIAGRIRPEALDLGLSSALAGLTTDLSKRTGLRIERRLGAAPADMPDEVEVVVYRVVQEALTNVARHADATYAEVSVERSGDTLVATVDDDGRGVGDAATGAGIRGMRERALLAGGRVSIGARAGGGTSVRLEVPLGEAR